MNYCYLNIIFFFLGLFRNAIIQSGSPLAHWAVRQRPSLPDVYYNIFTSAFDCLSNNTYTVKQCLQSVTADEIFRKTSGGHAVSDMRFLGHIMQTNKNKYSGATK